MQKHFQAHKQQLFKLTEKLGDVIPDENLIRVIPEIRNNLQQERFRLVVLGQFKRGKSTFINALLGDKILPTDVIPVTAVITEIHHSDEASAQVFFFEGEAKQVAIHELDEYVSENRNPKNTKKVDKVVVGYPAAILEKGLIIVDTPGVGSIHEHNTRLTQEYLLQADAAVFVFSADPPLTELEKGFLKVLIPIIPHIHFVLNKSDYLDHDDLSKVIAFNKKILQELVNGETYISPLSALQGLKAKLKNENGALIHSGLPALEQKLTDFLLQHRGRYFIISNAGRITRVCYEWKNLVELERKAQTISIDELNSNLDQFTQYMEKIKKNSNRLSYFLEEIKQRLLQYYDAETTLFIKDREEIVREKINHIINHSQQISKRHLLPHIKQSLINVVIDEFEPYRLRIEKNIKEKFNDEIQYLNGEVTQVINDIYRFSAELFQISQTIQLRQDTWLYQSQFYYKTWEVEGALELIQNVFMILLPRSLFNALTKRNINKVVSQKLDQQWGRFRSDLFYGLNDNNRKFLYEFNQILNRIADEISQLIKRYVTLKKQGEQNFEETLLIQEHRVAEVDNILSEVQKIKNFWEDAAAVN
ncbi:dynamin family protein [candidate division KSB1 bacterium]|nr:dynamin family protein [candidate division KSB1 bacterium]